PPELSTLSLHDALPICLLLEASELVIATDADREGEMIARELVEHCRYRGPIQRLWLSALDDASIRKALAALKPGAETFSLYHSRSEEHTSELQSRENLV